MLFIKEFFKHPLSVGAVASSGKSLANTMTAPIDFGRASAIVEYGPGTGSFTEKLIEKRSEECKLILIEKNREFYVELKEKYGTQKNLFIINGSAEFVEIYLQELHIDHVDYIVSGLPFTSLPCKMTKAILSSTRQVIKNHGTFITFQYTMAKKNLFTTYFKINNCSRVWKNIPPAYVFSLVSRNE